MGKNKKHKTIQQINNNQNSEVVSSQQYQQPEQTIIQQMTMRVTPMVQVPYDQYNGILKENIELHAKISQLTLNKTELLNIISQNGSTIEELKKENEKLKQMYDELVKQNKILTEEKELLIEKNEKLEENLNKLLEKDKLVEALSKIHDCDALSNKAFKNEYRSFFNLKKYDTNVPNISDFVLNPPDKNTDQEDYDFWFKFCKKHPGSDNVEFNKIYKQINKDRVDYGAHSNIYDMSKPEFDKYLKIAMPTLDVNIRNQYRDWLYTF